MHSLHLSRRDFLKTAIAAPALSQLGFAQAGKADPWNQTIFALPMILLYGISIVIAWGFGPRRARRDA